MVNLFLYALLYAKHFCMHAFLYAKHFCMHYLCDVLKKGKLILKPKSPFECSKRYYKFR